MSEQDFISYKDRWRLFGGYRHAVSDRQSMDRPEFSMPLRLDSKSAKNPGIVESVLAGNLKEPSETNNRATANGTNERESGSLLAPRGRNRRGGGRGEGALKP